MKRMNLVRQVLQKCCLMRCVDVLQLCPVTVAGVACGCVWSLSSCFNSSEVVLVQS